jgi:hypothetical protein
VYIFETTPDLDGPSPYAMSAAEYLRRSKREESKRVRELLEACFSRYPEHHRSDLEGKLLSPDDRQHEAAAFELVMHEFFCRSGFDVEIHPRVANNSQRPDFLTSLSNEPKILIELALATEVSDLEWRKAKLFNTVCDALNAMNSPDFFVWIRRRKMPSREVSKRKLTADVGKWLDSLSYDKALEREDTSLERMPKFFYTDQGFEIEFIAIPKPPQVRGDLSIRTLATTGVNSGWSRAAISIESKLRDKSNKYGELQHPFVVALSVQSLTMDNDEIMKALFGPVACPINFVDNEPVSGQPYRQPGGVWLTRNGEPVNQRLSAALIVRGLVPWNLGSVRWKLYHNPWAFHDLEQDLLDVPQMIWDAGEPQEVEGEQIWKKLALWEGWPEGKPRNPK